MPPEPLIQWPEPIVQLIGFIAQFLAAGAIGFRFFALKGSEIETDRPFYDDAARRAAMMGLFGIAISVVTMLWELPGQAARKHLGSVDFLASTPQSALQLMFLVCAVVGFALACAHVRAGWPLAAIGVVAGSLRAVFAGKWTSLVNPIHVLAAGLWIGTLFVLVVAGLSALLKHEPTKARRSAIAADMVNGFSPLALSMGAVVVTFGLITAWRHLHHLSALWTTPYGYALIVKLVFVAMVFALGAWNWRRQRPTLGTEGAAASIRRSATTELTVAAIVLMVTAIIVSLPSPKG
ncbi:MAG: CopD family protein [Gemmatimonadaceae bacterium]